MCDRLTQVVRISFATILLLTAFSFGQERTDFLISYNDGVPGQTWPNWMLSGCYFWPGSDPYWNDPPSDEFSRINTVRFYNNQMNVPGELPFKIVVAEYSRSHLPRISERSMSLHENSEGRIFGSLLFISEVFHTYCDQCWIEIDLDLDLYSIGYPVFDDGLVGVFVMALTEGPEPGMFVPAIPVDSATDHPYSGMYASDLPPDGDEMFISQAPDEWGLGDILLEVEIHAGVISARTTSFSEIKSGY